MHPTLYHFTDTVGIHSYGLLILLALLSAFTVSSNRAAKIGVDPDDLPGMYLLVAMMGILGARLFYFVFSEPKMFFANPMVFFDGGEGGLVFYGGAIGGTLSGVAFCWWKKIPVMKMADIGGPAIMLGLAVGRLGCFFAGCCHGAEVVQATVSSVLIEFQGGSVVWLNQAPYLSLIFKPGVGVGSIHNLPTYPTQLWEFTGAMTLFGALSFMWHHLRKFDGQILATTMIFYAGLRSSIENFRGDSIRGENVVETLSTSQFISVVMLALSAVLMIVGYTRGLAPETEFIPSDDDLDDGSDEDLD